MIEKFKAMANALLAGLPEDLGTNELSMMCTEKLGEKGVNQYKMVAAFNDGEMELAMTVTHIPIPPAKAADTEAPAAPTTQG